MKENIKNLIAENISAHIQQNYHNKLKNEIKNLVAENPTIKDYQSIISKF